MKRFVSLLICLLLFVNISTFPAAATMVDNQPDMIMVSQTVEPIGNNCFYIETIYVPSVQPLSNTKTGTKTAVYVTSGISIFSVAVTGEFTYDGTKSKATSSLCTVATYVEDATIEGKNAYTSGASAYAFGSVSYHGATLQKTVVLTCDKDGKLT